MRAKLRAEGILTAAELRDIPNGNRVRTAGHVIVCQRPLSAKGFTFLTLEDETGTSNAILTPPNFKRFRVPLHSSSVIEIAGPLQNAEGVIHVRIEALRPLTRATSCPVATPIADRPAPADSHMASPNRSPYHPPPLPCDLPARSRSDQRARRCEA
jgi:DNA polymerase III alpha subunit